MAASSTPVTRRHLDYLAARTAPEDAFLQQLKQAARDAGLPAIWIAPEQASFMQIVLKIARARRVVEVGTLAGVSAIILARALPPDGRVWSIERDPERAAFARCWIARSDVAHKVEVRTGTGAEQLDRMEDASADAVFLDADKAGYGLYLQQSLRILRPGGLVMVDNAFAFGQLFDDVPTDPEVDDVRRFNEVMAGEASLHSIIAPLGDGMWLGVKRLS